STRRRDASALVTVVSGGELGAALGAAGVQDAAAGAGAHAGAEAVLLGAAAVVRLERALAHGSPRSWARACPSRWRVVCCANGCPGAPAGAGRLPCPTSGRCRRAARSADCTILGAGVHGVNGGAPLRAGCGPILTSGGVS